MRNSALATMMASAYGAQVMGSGNTRGFVKDFVMVGKEDPEFIDTARAELARCRSVSARCFVSLKNAQFLDAALSEWDRENAPKVG